MILSAQTVDLFLTRPLLEHLLNFFNKNENYFESKSGSFLDIERALTELKKIFYSKDKQSRIIYLKDQLLKTYNSKLSVNDFKEFGQEIRAIQRQINDEIRSLN